MQPQNNAAEAPVIVNGTSQPTHAKGSTDSLVSAAMEALADLGGPPANDTGRKAPGKPGAEEQRPAAEDGDAEDEESLPGAGDSEGDEADDDAGEEGETHDTRGSRENPLSAKDIDKDIHVEVKVDGKKETVTLREAIDGFVGQKTINQRLNQAKVMADELQQLQSHVKEEKQRVVQAVREVLGSADQLYDYLMASDEREQVLLELAQRYAGTTKKFREDPHARVAFQRQRDLARIQAEREHFESQRRAELEAKQREEHQQRVVSIMKPGWEAGLRRAGFPQMDQRQQQELLSEVMIRCEQRQRSGHEVTSDDVAEFVARAAKLLELPRKGDKRPKAAPIAPVKERQSKRADPWEGKSKRERIRSPEFFMKGLRPRDYR